jgi:hypothetical protein
MRLAFLVDCVSRKEGLNRATNRLTIFAFPVGWAWQKQRDLTED